MIELNDHTLKSPTIASRLDKWYWLVIKQVIFNEFESSNIKLIVYNNGHSSKKFNQQL